MSSANKVLLCPFQLGYHLFLHCPGNEIIAMFNGSGKSEHFLAPDLRGKSVFDHSE